MKKILSIIIVAILLTSCRRDKILLPECRLTATNLVGFYKIIDVKFSAGGSALTSVYNNPTYFAQCRKDDVLFLGSTGNFGVNDNATICSPRSSNSSGSWSLSGFNNLNFVGNIEGESFTVENFTCISMELKQTAPLPNTNTSFTYVYYLDRL